MPNPYTNPDRKPAVGGFNWVPKGPPTGGSTPFGFNSLTLQRGTFRNDIPYRPGTPYEKYNGSVLVMTPTGSVESGDDSQNWPILAAFRPYNRPSINLGPPPTQPFIIKGDNLKWQVRFGSGGDQTAQLSSVTFHYALTIDLTDTEAVTALTLTSEERQSIQDFLAGKIDRPSIDWAKSKFGRIGLENSDGTFTYFPPNDSSGKPLELGLTDYEHRVSNPETGQTQIVSESRTLTVHFGTSPTGGDLKFVKSFFIEAAKKLSSLRLTLYKVMLFNYKRCNFQDGMLPCTHLSYAYRVGFDFDPTLGSGIYPKTGLGGTNYPNLHVKFFSPEDRGGTVGMCHSVNLRFLMVSLPVYGLSPGGTTLGDLLGDIASPSFYYTMLIGPTAGKRSLRYSLTPSAFGSSAGRVVPLDASPKIDTHATSLTIQKQSRTDKTAWYDIAQYPIGSTVAFDPSQGPFISPMLLLDQGAYTTGTEAGVKTTDKYRVLQKLPSGLVLQGPEIGNQTYIEHRSLRMTPSSDGVTSTSKETIKRHVPLKDDLPGKNPLLAAPLAVFMMDDPNPLSAPITMTRGAWRFRMRAAVNDPDGLLETHLVVRFWFQPESERILAANPHKWRSATEFFFKPAHNTELSQFLRGSPTSLGDVMVSPPLPNDVSDIEIIRYIDTLEVDGKAITDWRPPFDANVRANLVCGVYAFGVPREGSSLTANTLNPPLMTLEIDSDTAFVETTIQQVLSNTIFAQRVPLFSQARYVAAESPLAATRYLGGVGDNTDTPEEHYLPYTGTFQRLTDNASGDDFSAFKGVAVLDEGGSDVAQHLAIPITSVSRKKEPDTDVFVRVDFATSFLPLANGRVAQGGWSVKMKLNRGVDNVPVGMALRLEAFLVSGDGRVTERIYYANNLQAGLAPNIGSEEVNWTWNNDIPFQIGGSGTQLVLRVTCYPYSRDGNAVKISDLQSALPEGSPVGVRIDSLIVEHHTLERTVVTSTGGDTGSGSPGFWENLKIVPSRALDSQQFWYVASADNLLVALTPSDKPRSIDGTLYGPAWQEPYPIDMEVDVRAAGLGDNNLWIRTVPGEGTASGQDRVSAVEEHRTGAVHVALAEPQEGVSTLSSDDTSGMVIRHYIFDTPYDLPNQDTLVRGSQGEGLSSLTGRYPSLSVVLRDGSQFKQGGVVSLAAQIDTTNGPSVRGALNGSGGMAQEWVEPNRSLQGGNFNKVRRIARDFAYPIHVRIPSTGLTLLGGWVKPGCIMVRVQGAFASGSTGEPDTPDTLLLVDGDAAPEITEHFETPSGTLMGVASETFPGLIAMPNGEALCVYAVEGQDGILYCRNISSGLNVSSAYPVVNLRAQSGFGSSELAILGPVLASGKSSAGIWAAFWVGGKILAARIDTVRGNRGLLEPLVLVAGGRNFSTSDNKANPAFAQMQSSKHLYINQGGNEENDIPPQSPALVVSEKHPNQGKLLVYYKDSRGDLRQRIVDFYSGVSAPLILSRS